MGVGTGIMKANWLAIIVLIGAMEVEPALAQSRHNAFSEQTHFSAEDESVEKPVAIPNGVVVILKKDELVGGARIGCAEI